MRYRMNPEKTKLQLFVQVTGEIAKLLEHAPPPEERWDAQKRLKIIELLSTEAYEDICRESVFKFMEKYPDSLANKQRMTNLELKNLAQIFLQELRSSGC